MAQTCAFVVTGDCLVHEVPRLAPSALIGVAASAIAH